MPVLDCRIPKEDWLCQVSERCAVSASPAQHAAQESVEDARPWEPAIRKLVEFQCLGDDWDGFGAPAPSRELLESGIGLAGLLFKKGVHPPHRVVPGLEGSVNLEWQDPDGTIAEVEIDRPFHAEVMLIEPGQPARHWTLPTDD